MAIDVKTLALAKRYTDTEIAGGGAIKGKNCVVSSIADITGGHRVTFQWTLDNGTVETGTMDVLDGDKGETGLGIKSVAISASNHLIVTYDDNTTADAGEITNITTNIAHISDIDLDNLSDGQILKYNAATGKWENASAGSVDTDLVDLNDVDVESLTDGQIIVWDATNSKWVNADAESGIPDGGTTGQALVKHSNTDGDVEWATVNSIPDGGTTGQALVKHSNSDKDVEWGTVYGAPSGGTTGQLLAKHSNDNGDMEWVDAESIQVSSMPTASADELGKVYQFIGATDVYTHGYFYECVSDGESTPTYSWSQVEVSKGGHDIKNNGVAVTSRDTMNFTDFDIADDSTNLETDIKAHRLTASELTDIVSPLPGTPITLPILFDETGAETQVGWYKLSNGTKKPVYRKNFSATNSAKSESILLSNAITRSNSFIIEGYGVKHVGTSGDSNDIAFPYANASISEKPYIYINQNTEGTYLTVYNINIGCNFNVTLLYTKTTDTPS